MSGPPGHESVVTKTFFRPAEGAGPCPRRIEINVCSCRCRIWRLNPDAQGDHLVGRQAAAAMRPVLVIRVIQILAERQAKLQPTVAMDIAAVPGRK
jgi:hypothetical protein